MKKADVHGLNENHQRRLRVTFQYIDKLLLDASHAMEDATSVFPFREHSNDTTPIQRKVVRDYIFRIRDTMRRVMEDIGIMPPQPRSGATWATGVSLTFCSISLSEITAERMRGYGDLTDEAASALAGIRGELGSLIDKLSAYLAEGGSGDLQKRLEHLGRTRDEVCLLGEIERIVTAHGLIEFHAALAMLLDRLENAALEIGVFGRVSAGKSSLLNYILQTDVLPVGVTPATAIPTRISYGRTIEVKVEFAEASARKIPFNELAQYATEEQNPSNRKHVTKISVTLPSPRLSEGVTFVDTPGLGSLALAGAEETVAYLPRCDLGVVLIDASAGLTQEDLVTIQALYRSGATAMVLVSKADLFTADDRERMLAYVKANLCAQLRLEPPVYPISVHGEEAELCDRWFENALRPIMSRHRELAIETQKRKAGALRDAVIAALQRRLTISGSNTEDTIGLSPTGSSTSLQEAEQALERAQNQAYFFSNKVVQAKPDIMAAATEAIAAGLVESQDADPREKFATAITHVLAEPVAAILHLVEQTRETVERSIDAMVPRSPNLLNDELPKPAGLPPLDAAPIANLIKINKPVVLTLFGKTALTGYVRRKLGTKVEQNLFEFLSGYSNRLRRWAEQSIKELREAYDARTGLRRALLTASGTVNPVSQQALHDDLEILQHWESRQHSEPGKPIKLAKAVANSGQRIVRDDAD